MGDKTGPGVDGNTPAGYNIVDKLTVAGSEIEHACVRRHAVAEKCIPKSLPEYVATAVGCEAGFVIIFIHAGGFHPKVSPRIMPRPTLSARRLCVFPPLLTPTRG